MIHKYIANKSTFRTAQQLIQFFRQQSDILEDGRLTVDLLYYDTFDWRLYLKGYHLYFINQAICLFNFLKLKYNSGSICLLFLIISKCKCGPVARPVLPTVAIRSPGTTRSPS